MNDSRPSIPFGVFSVLVLSLVLSRLSVAQVGPPVAPGFPNVPQAPGTVLSGLNAPEQGRTAVIAYHGGVLFTVPEVPSSEPFSDTEVRSWDITDPQAPRELARWGVTAHPVSAHGYIKEGEHLVLGPNWPPGEEWSFRVPSQASVVRESSVAGGCAGDRGCLFQPWYVGQTFWSYNPVGGNAEIHKLDPQCGWSCPSPLASWDHLGVTGVIGHPFLIGDLLIFASDQSRTGVATYDVSDPTNPVLLDVLNTGGPGGYWPEIWGGDGRLYIVFPYRLFGNGMRIVDATDPTDLRFIADRPLPGVEAMYAQFQDEYAFIGSHKVDMRTFESVLYFDPNSERPNQPGTFGIDTSQFALPLGNLLVTGGIGTNQGMAIWAHQAEPDTRGPSVGFHIPQAGRTGYPVGAPITLLIHETLETTTIINGETFIVRPLGGDSVAGRILFSFNDILTFTPDEPLLPDTTYEVILPQGGIKDAAGNGIAGYSFTFSTGLSVGGNLPPTISDLGASAYPIAPGANVTLSGSATDPNQDPLEYRFDFGDGSPRTSWSTSTQATTSYTTPGHYRASIQARDPGGLIATMTRTVTVLDPASTPHPTQSSQLACDTQTRHVWAVNPDNDVIVRVDADTLQRELETPVCDDPRALATAGSGEVWVACRGDDSVAVVDDSGAIVTSLPLAYGSAPAGIVATPDGSTIFVALEGRGELRRYDVASRVNTGTLALGPRPRALAVSGDGSRILVTRLLSAADYAEVWDVDAASMTLTRSIRIPKFGGDANRDATASGRGVANYLTGIAIAPDGATAWVTANKPNSERGLLFGPDLDQDNTVRNIVVQLDLASGSVRRAIDLDNSDSASAVSFSPLGDYLFVTLQGNNQVVVLDTLSLDTSNGLGASVTRLATGRAPQSVCSDATSNRTFTADLLSRTLTALETEGLFVDGDISVETEPISLVSQEAMAPSVLRGKQIFYDASDRRMSSEGYLSCATCHLDGGHDGRVWDFTGRGEGLRNTITLHGRAGMGHGNVHWSGNFDEIQDFENDVRLAFGGSGFLEDSDFLATQAPLGPTKAGLSPDLDALATYVASLGVASLPRSPWRAADGRLTAAAESGREHFLALGCATCHAGDTTTDSTLGSTSLHDVGTLRTTSGQRLGAPLDGIDTPSLLGIWDTAPYLHDGSASTMEEVFFTTGGVVYPAEDATPIDAVSIIDRWVDLNNDDTVHGRALAYFGPDTGRLVFSDVDGGNGGIGVVALRYSSTFPIDVFIVANGTSHRLSLPTPDNDPPDAHFSWRQARIEGIELQAGSVNTIEIVPDIASGLVHLSLDEILVSTSAWIAAAAPHRAARTLSNGERQELVAWLNQLDGRDDNGQLPSSLTLTPTPTPTPTPSPSAEPVCPTTPRSQCIVAERGRLKVADGTPARRKFAWRWHGAGDVGAFGDPTSLPGNYQFCLYLGDTLALQVDLPAGGDCGGRSCWRGDARGYRFNDRFARNDGVRRAQAKAQGGDLRLQLSGGGTGMPSLPATTGTPRAQWTSSSTGACWETLSGDVVSRAY